MTRRGVLAESIGTAALAGLLFGFDTAVVAGVTADWRRVFGLGDVELGLTVSAAVWGTFAGAALAGIPGDRFGSRAVLRVLALFYIVSGVGAAVSSGLGGLVVARVITGLAIGGSSVLAPVYIAEIAPPDRRGRLVGLFQFNVVLGILIAFLSNAVVARLGLGEAAWRWKLAVPVLPALLFLLLLWRIPDSPRWLLGRGREAEARAASTAIGADPDRAVADARAALATDVAERSSRLSWRRHRRPIVLAVLLAAFNQLAGINAILYYSNDIFAAAGFTGVSADLQVVTVGATNLLFTMVGLALIDRAGRKTLLLVGAAGMVVCLFAAAAVFAGALPPSLLIVVLVGYIAFFAPSQGAVIWVYLSEIFPQAVRARGTALGSSTHWLLNATIALVFPSLARVSKPLPFLIFGACMIAQFIVVLLFFPETKGVTLEAMDARMKKTA